MKKVREYIILIRPKHFIKNLLIFLPCFFGMKLFDEKIIVDTVIGFLTFCLACSIVYIFNDIRDRDKDRLHRIKRYRPVASGKVLVKNASIFLAFMAFAMALVGIIANIKAAAWLVIMVYIAMNVFYSLCLKELPVIDVFTLVSFYLLRIIYGG